MTYLAAWMPRVSASLVQSCLAKMGISERLASQLFSRLILVSVQWSTTTASDFAERLLPFADEIIVLNEGAVVDRGTYQEILTRTPEVALQSLNKAENGTAEEQTEAESSIDSGARSSNKQQDTEEAPDFSRRDGTWDVYKYYVKNTGLWTTIFFLATCLLTAFFDNFSSELNLLVLWVSDNSSYLGSVVGKGEFEEPQFAGRTIPGCLCGVYRPTYLGFHRRLLVSYMTVQCT